MLANFSYSFYPTWSIGPLVIFILAFLIICFLLLSRSSTRGLIGYSAFVGVLAGLVYYIIIVAIVNGLVSLRDISSTPASYVFYSIYISFTFVPGLIAFHRISKANRSAISKLTVYFGYLWAFAIIVIGLALAIRIGVKMNDVNRPYDGSQKLGTSPRHIANLFTFMCFSGWAFVAAYLVLIAANIGHIFSGKPRNSLIAYSALSIIAVLAFTIMATSAPNSSSVHVVMSTVFVVTFIFCDITTAIALIMATYYGNLWTPNREAAIGDKLEITESSNMNESNV